MRLSAIDAVQHGLQNIAANWHLVLIQVLMNLAVTVLFLAGAVPIVLAIGWNVVRTAFEQMSTGRHVEIAERLVEAGMSLVLAVVAAFLIWTAAFVVYCWVQAGTLGVLAEAESGVGKPGRVFSAGGFKGHAERLTWPVFWIINLFMAIGTVLLIVGFGLLALFFMAAAHEMRPLVFVFGCFGLLAGFLLMFVFSLWMQLSLAKLAIGGRGVLQSCRDALATGTKRLPGLALIFLLMITASIAMTVVVLPLSMVLEVGFRDQMAGYLVGQGVISVLQWVVASVITVSLTATLIALVRGEQEWAP